MKFDLSRWFRSKTYSLSQQSMLRWLRLAIAAMVLMTACADETAPRRGQIIVALQTDMDIPKDLESLRVVVLVNGTLAHDRSYKIGPDEDEGENMLPATIAIGAEKVREERDEVDVRIIAEQGSDAVTLSRLVTTIPERRIATLYMPIQWLCKGQVELNAALPGQWDSSCPTLGGEQQACIAGKCEPVDIEEESLPDFDWKDIYGGGDTPQSGTCFDTVPCFDDGEDIIADSDCTFEIDPDDLEDLSVGLRLAGGSDGICDEDDERCYVPLDRHALFGWKVLSENKTRAVIQVPEAACDRVSDREVEQIRITTSCIQKAPKVPTCGPWSSVEDNGTTPDGSGGAKNVIDPTAGAGGEAGTGGQGGMAGSSGQGGMAGSAGSGGEGATAGSAGEGGSGGTSGTLTTLTGVVLDAATGEPLAGVQVTITDSATNTIMVDTDENGIYTAEVAPGPVQVTYTVAGYVDAIGSFDVAPGSTTEANAARLAPAATDTGMASFIGYVRDSQNASIVIPDATVTVRSGVNIRTGNIVDEIVTDSYGYFYFEALPIGTYTLEVSASGFSTTYWDAAVVEGQSNMADVLLSRTLQAGQLRIVLSWGATPGDLDSWLQVPVDETTVYNVWYSSLGASDQAPFALLDTDARQGFGPETITVSQAYPGTYRYVVHNYEAEGGGTADFSVSNARVQVYGESGLVYEASVPSGTGLHWHVFDFDGSTLDITPVDNIGLAPFCPQGPTVADCGSGCIVDTYSDAANCGACGVTCDTGSSEYCDQGECIAG